VAALATELESRRIREVAVRADAFQLAPAFTAELHRGRVIKLALGAFHPGASPWRVVQEWLRVPCLRIVLKYRISG
jgi:hypothetical protein